MNRTIITFKRIVVLILAGLLLTVSALSGMAFKTIADETEDLTKEIPIKLNLDETLAGMSNESFTFQLTAKTDGAPVPDNSVITFRTDKATDSFTDSFGPITFPKPTDDEPVTYEYQIVQTTPDKDNFVLDKTVYNVTFFVYLEYSYVKQEGDTTVDYPQGEEIVRVTVTLQKEGEQQKPSEISFENSFEQKYITIEGTKTWDDSKDEAGLRPDQITVNLLADGTIIDSTQAKKADGWHYSFGSRPKFAGGIEITYTVQEEGVTGYTPSYDGYDITNTHKPGKTGLSVQKVWNDEDDLDGSRPDSIQLQLLANGSPKGDPVTVKPDEKGNWYYEWKDLPEISGGKTVVYSVKEISVDGYESKTSGDASTGIVITNTHKPELGILRIVKELKAHEHVGERIDPSTFVFRAEIYSKKGKLMRSEIVSMVFTESGTQTKEIKDIPVGSKVIVREVYAGGNYAISGDNAIERVIIKDDETTVEIIEAVEAAFTNVYNDKWKGGGSIHNHITSDGGQKTYSDGTSKDINASDY